MCLFKKIRFYFIVLIGKYVKKFMETNKHYSFIFMFTISMFYLNYLWFVFFIKRTSDNVVINIYQHVNGDNLL
jgi:hypothetical protein